MRARFCVPILLVCMLIVMPGLDGLKVAEITKSCQKPVSGQRCFGYRTVDAPQTDACNRELSELYCPFAFARVVTLDPSHYLVQLVGKARKGFTDAWVGIAFADPSKKEPIGPSVSFGLVCVGNGHPPVWFLYGTFDDQSSVELRQIKDDRNPNNPFHYEESVQFDGNWIICEFKWNAEAWKNYRQGGSFEDFYKVALFGNSLKGLVRLIGTDSATVKRYEYLVSSSVKMDTLIAGARSAGHERGTKFGIQMGLGYGLLLRGLVRIM